MTTDAAISSVPGLTPVCVLPNVALNEPIEASRAAFLPWGDARLDEIASREIAETIFALLETLRAHAGIARRCQSKFSGCPGCVSLGA
jgi:hypothetical protein